METSTPIRLPDVAMRKRIQARVSLTPLRRTSLAPLNTSIESIINDDERERSARRDKEEENRRLSTIIQQQQTDSPKLDGPQLSKHYDMCIKMFSENKINSQNVWNLRIIDYMKVILRDQTNITNTFQVASATLDVSTKVYGIRVDDIYSDGMKLANSMARNVAKGKENNENGIEDEQPMSDGEEGGKKNEKKTKRKKFKKTTVQKNIDLLIGPVLQAENTTLLASLNRNAVQNTESLFMRKLPLSHGGNKLEMLSNTAEFLPKDKPESFIADDKLSFQIFPTDGKHFEICPAFRDFVLDKWNPDEENVSLMIESAQLDRVVMDDEGIPIPELDGSVNDIFAQVDDGAEMENDLFDEEAGEGFQLHGDVAHVQDFRPQSDNTKSNEYLHNTAITEHRAIVSGLWAGPSHWKVKYIHNRASARYSGKVCVGQMQKPTRARRARNAGVELITFEIADLDIDEPKKSDTENVLKTVCTTADKYLDPEEEHFDFVLPGSLLIEGLKIHRKAETNAQNENGAEQQPDDDEMSVDNNDGFDYENPNDSEYCSQGTVPNADGETEVNGNGEHCDIMENLVAAPALIPKTFVSYATQSKKMDMKKLKVAVFETINNKSVKAKTKPELEECTFSEVYQALPKVLPAKMAKDLSCPLAFVSLLHLANENNLELEDIDHRDIRIYKTGSGIKRKL